MVKQDFIDGLKLYVTYKMQIDPWTWNRSGPNGAKFRRNVWRALEELGFPDVAKRRILNISSNYSTKDIEKAKYNDLIYKQLKRLIAQFADAFSLADTPAVLFDAPNPLTVSTKVPMHLLNHFKTAELGRVVIPSYSLWHNHPWVNKFLEDPLGYLEGRWSESTELPVTGIPLSYPTEGVVQYVGTITPTRREYPDGSTEILDGSSDARDERPAAPSVPGAW